jgi:hypothetical protein
VRSLSQRLMPPTKCWCKSMSVQVGRLLATILWSCSSESRRLSRRFLASGPSVTGPFARHPTDLFFGAMVAQAARGKCPNPATGTTHARATSIGTAANLHTCMCTYIYTHADILIHVRRSVNICKDIHILLDTGVYVDIHTCMHTCIHDTHTSTHITSEEHV